MSVDFFFFYDKTIITGNLSLGIGKIVKELLKPEILRIITGILSLGIRKIIKKLIKN